MNKKSKWYFPTNTINLRMIIAQGLITSPDGFKKYYSDALEFQPGWIPLYKDEVHPEAIQHCLSERENLTPCILEIDLNRIKGTAKAFKSQEFVDILLENINTIDINLIFILAPLPLSCIFSVIFRKAEEKDEFINDVKIRDNVVLGDIKLLSNKSYKKLFNVKTLPFTYKLDIFSTFPESPAISIKEIKLPSNKINYEKIFSYGGMIVNLFYYAKNGHLSNNIFQSVIECHNFTDNQISDINLILEYFKKRKTEQSINSKKRMYNGIIRIAIRSDNFKEDIIEFLESNSWEANIKKRAIDLANKLRMFESVITQTVSEQFKNAKTSLEKMLLMLFLREDSESLIEYDLNIFTEEEYILFAMLFGIRDKYSKTPRFIKETDSFLLMVSNKMASYAHEEINSSLQFKNIERNLTIIDMLKNYSFIKWFAKHLDVESSFQTTIKIPKGDYKLKVNNSGVEIIVEGITQKPSYELIKEKYFNSISKLKLTEYQKFSTKYKKLKQ